MNLCRAVTQAEHASAVFPGALAIVAGSAAADDGDVLRSGDFKSGVEVPGDGHHQAAILRMRIESFSIPAFRQSQRKTAILHIRSNLAAGLFDCDPAILRFECKLTGALFYADAAILGVCFSSAGEPVQRDAAIADRKIHVGIFRSFDHQQRAQAVIVIIVIARGSTHGNCCAFDHQFGFVQNAAALCITAAGNLLA